MPDAINICCVQHDVLCAGRHHRCFSEFEQGAGQGRGAGNTVGTLLHSDFGCPQYVRRRPSRFESQHDPKGFLTPRVLSLQINAETFTQKVLKG